MIKPRQEGFTLIEVLVAVFILAIILGAIYTSFFVIHDAISSTRGTVVKLQEARATMEVMRRELEAAMDGRHDFELQDRDYYGNPASVLSFDTHLSPLPGGARVRYFIEEGQKDGQLVLMKRIGPQRSDLEYENPAIEDMEAVEDVVSFKVEVTDKQDRTLTTWDNLELLPEQFTVTLSIKVHGAEVPLKFVTRSYLGRVLK